MIANFKTIDYYYTSDVSIKNGTYSAGFGITNNLNMCIPKDLIKDIFFTDITNTDGNKVRWSKTDSSCLDTRNNIVFMPCNKLQTSNTFIKLIFINGAELTTTNSRKVSIV